MQVKNQLVFGLVAILPISGTILPGIAQSESDEEQSKIIVNLDSATYDLNQKITVSGQVVDFTPNKTNPTKDAVNVIFIDSTSDFIASTSL